MRHSDFCGARSRLWYRPRPLHRSTRASSGAGGCNAVKTERHPGTIDVSSKKQPVKKAAGGSRGKIVGTATAAAILGGGGPSPRAATSRAIDPEWERYRQILLDLREQLVRQMNGLAKESAEQLPGYSMHMADSGTDNFDRDFALSLLSSDQDAIYEIDEALKRIERGSYGVCELTGKAIPKARLDAIPWARFTVEAQAQLEREGALRHRRLGSLGTLDAGAPAEIEEDDEVEEKPSKEKE
ncbi:MAG: TraR/DksA C4-type zinc finger protein [Verrucomicrobiae bacterium]|nr:TraR/DksA C4-type zinc finger protein [Verrucomicrobiae bacterium]